MLDLQVSGMGQLTRIAKLCNEAGDKTIRREVTKALKVATEPVKADVRRATDRLPQRGGLGAQVAAARITTRTSLRGNNPSIRLTDRWSGHDLRRIDAGILRHPVPGTKKWVNQKVAPGFWSDPIRARSRQTRVAVIFAMKNVARMVARG